METTLNRRTLEWACKQYLLDGAKTDKSLKESSSLNERKAFAKWVKDLTYEQTLGILFEQNHKPDTQGIRDIEKKFKVILSIGLAASLGGIVGAAVGAARGSDAGIVAGYGAHVVSFVATVIYAQYKQKRDPCFQQCKRVVPPSVRDGMEGSVESLPLYRVCATKCSLSAAMRILSEIKSEKSKCSRTKNPDKCRTRLEKLDQKWTQKIEDLRSDLRKAEEDNRRDSDD